MRKENGDEKETPDKGSLQPGDARVQIQQARSGPCLPDDPGSRTKAWAGGREPWAGRRLSKVPTGATSNPFVGKRATQEWCRSGHSATARGERAFFSLKH